MNSALKNRMRLLAVLEFIVGGIVVLGAAALVDFSNDTTGMSLGVVHAVLGLTAFLSGYILLTGKVRARTLIIVVNAAIIVFSTVSEIILSTTGSLPSGPFADSVIGTAVAVLIATIILYQIMRPRSHASAAGPSSAH